MAGGVSEGGGVGDGHVGFVVRRCQVGAAVRRREVPGHGAPREGVGVDLPPAVGGRRRACDRDLGSFLSHGGVHGGGSVRGEERVPFGCRWRLVGL